MFFIQNNQELFRIIQTTSSTRIWIIQTEFQFDIIISPKLKLPSSKPSVYIRNIIKKLATTNLKINPSNAGEILIKFYSNEELMKMWDNKWFADENREFSERITNYEKKINYYKHKILILNEKYNANK